MKYFQLPLEFVCGLHLQYLAQVFFVTYNRLIELGADKSAAFAIMKALEVPFSNVYKIESR